MERSKLQDDLEIATELYQNQKIPMYLISCCNSQIYGINLEYAYFLCSE